MQKTTQLYCPAAAKPAVFVLLLLFRTAYTKIPENSHPFCAGRQVWLFSEISRE
jgi:hypothetical protein